ncbi:MAG: FAD-dependent oxidoreductase [Elusimicrobia bacterium]|nr:FAD-dependent oxidoreductase [Elusimicrobiota bacterium]
MGEDNPLISRRAFLWAGGSLLGAAAASQWRRWLPAGRPIEGSIVGPSFAAAHRLRDGIFPAPALPAERTAVAILGGGISGLSAAWKLERSGLADFRVLELEDSAGGNARSGDGPAGAYPWGAHYVPFPQPESRAVSELLRELKVEVGRDRLGRPIYNDRYVCFAPEERLFVHGRWQEGLYPTLGTSRADAAERARFERLVRALRRRKGSDGRRAFAIPLEESSRDPELLALDRLSMAAWLDREGFTSAPLRWFVEYACRDDYGTLLADTSAWAGLHYFAARGEGSEDQVLTWPEGNGWLVRRLAAIAGARIRPRALVFRVAPAESGVAVDWLDTQTGKARRLLARAALVCLPQFVAQRVIEPWRRKPPAWAGEFRYAPWVVANLTVERPPEGRGAPPSWDNVIYGSPSLGYVDASHQSLSQDRRRAVWTYYRPLTGEDPRRERAQALAAPWSAWRDAALGDLSRALPGLKEHVRRIDVMVWGHGMVQPRPGFLWGPSRAAAARPFGRLFFGHSDLSGLSLFEEAQYRGVRAAQDAMTALGRPFTASV